MKIIVVGDVHGRDSWKSLKDKTFDKVVFVGDYFDSREGHPSSTQIKNFKEIMFWKKNNPKVITLLGNHDYHYLNGIRSQYSGFQRFAQDDIRIELEKNRQELDVVCYLDKFLFSHAGVTRTWMRLQEIEYIEDINEKFKVSPSILEFAGYDPYGNDISQGPTWVRPKSLLADKVPRLVHVVGHTSVDAPFMHRDKDDPYSGVIFTDCENRFFVGIDTDKADIELIHP